MVNYIDTLPYKLFLDYYCLIVAAKDMNANGNAYYIYSENAIALSDFGEKPVIWC